MSSLPALNYATAAPESRGIEERSHIRFPIALDAQYKFRRNGIKHCGTGRTLDISSGGVLFEADEIDTFKFPHKLAIELTLNWPYLLNQECALKLVIRGRFVRHHGRQIALRIKQYKFRTAGLVLQRSMPKSAARKG